MAKAFNPKPPKVLDDKQIEQLEALASFLTIPQIADFFMIAPATFKRILDRQPLAMSRYKKGKAQAVLSVANSLVSKARGGDITAQIFFLKTQGGWSDKSSDLPDEKPPAAKVVIKEYDGRKPSDT
ncbi:MAG: hypothetical protein K2Q13_01680 [Nitrosomonas sp.]|uniref:hypothetical protein n=1 Tax=Nitrosomonas sp. TaxID=42353 RepID=UPI0025F461B3|nr:hypothetical protein [Nitrosomonas sp.]MBY0473753.1 hypothetical protein [Nitrosomonas sp.]